MNHLTIALAYYENPHMLREQQRVISTWPEPVRKLTRLIVVDDASPNHPAHEAIGDALEHYHDPYKLEIYRIIGDVPWGQLRARNLGVYIAPPGSWVLATDIDHVLPPDCATKLLEFEPEAGCYYTFGRRNAGSNEPTNPHPNSYLMQREWFWDEVGGCNEDFVGWYGTDSIFRARAGMFGRSCTVPPGVWLQVYNRDGVDIGGIPGAATNLPRKDSRFHAKSNPEIKRKMARAHMVRPENRLRFKWERMR